MSELPKHLQPPRRCPKCGRLSVSYKVNGNQFRGCSYVEKETEPVGVSMKSLKVMARLEKFTEQKLIMEFLEDLKNAEFSDLINLIDKWEGRKE